MITRDLRDASRRDIYRILSSLVVPRPVAWVTTVGGPGILNLAPYASFMGVFSPPVVLLSVGRRRNGSLKDTHRNLRGSGEAVVHLVDLPLLEPMHASGEEVGPEESEVERLGLPWAPSTLVAPPRLKDAPAALECSLRQELSLGPASDLLLLDVLLIHAAERIWNPGTDCADPERWEPVARLNGGPGTGANYAALGRRFTLTETKLPPRRAGR